MELNTKAKAALINAHGRQGAAVHADQSTINQLKIAGVIGEGGGLTRFGLAVRSATVDEALDRAF